MSFVQLSSVLSFANGRPDDKAKENLEIVSPDNTLYGEMTQEGNLIEWISNTTERVEFFIVQRSVDGEHFLPIAMIYKKKQSRFSFVDRQTDNKKVYYRLIKVDSFGNGDFTNTISFD